MSHINNLKDKSTSKNRVWGGVTIKDMVKDKI